MRDFKLRAFNKATQIMYYPDCDRENFNHYLQVGSGGFWLYNKDGKLICTSVNGDVLMQYAGKEDKNLKEIYEGDQIKVAGRKLTVVFDNSTFLSVVDNDRYPLGQWGSEGIEIIGNIYEVNPARGNGPLHTMNIDPNVKPAEATEDQAAINATEDQANTVKEPDAEEGTTEG